MTAAGERRRLDHHVAQGVRPRHPRRTRVTPTRASSPTDPDNSMSAIATRGYADVRRLLRPLRHPEQAGVAKAVFQQRPGHQRRRRQAGEGGHRPTGWHVVTPKGLPNRYITSIAIDPKRPSGPCSSPSAATPVGGSRRVPAATRTSSSARATCSCPDERRQVVPQRDRQPARRAGHLGGAAQAPAAGRHRRRRVRVRLRGHQAVDAAVRPARRAAGSAGGQHRAEAGQPEPRGARPVRSRRVDLHVQSGRCPMPRPEPPQPPQVGTVASPGTSSPTPRAGPPPGRRPWTRESPGHGSGTADDAAGQAFDVAGPTGYTDNARRYADLAGGHVPAGTGVRSGRCGWTPRPGTTRSRPRSRTDGGATWSTTRHLLGQERRRARLVAVRRGVPVARRRPCRSASTSPPTSSARPSAARCAPRPAAGTACTSTTSASGPPAEDQTANARPGSPGRAFGGGAVSGYRYRPQFGHGERPRCWYRRWAR